MEDRIEIPLNKSWLKVGFAGSLCFVIAGIWMLLDTPVIHHKYIGGHTSLAITGLLTIFFFGLAGWVALRKIRDRRPGLTIDREGIVDNASGVSAGRIPWSDIRDLKVRNVMSQKFLMIIVENPEKYIRNGSNFIGQQTKSLNYRLYGSPIAIAERTLKIKFKMLHALVQDRWETYRKAVHQC